MQIECKKTILAAALEKGSANAEHISFIPWRGSPGAGAYDLRACLEQAITIAPGEVVKVPTGIHIHIGATPKSEFTLVGLILPRSSASGWGLENTIGLVDSDYTGELFVKYKNTGMEDKTLSPFERFAQILFVPAISVSFLEVKNFSTTTERGSNGFGSTGNI